MRKLRKISAASLALVCVLTLTIFSSGCTMLKKYNQKTETDTEKIAAGKTGDVSWSLNKELRTMTISGKGEMGSSLTKGYQTHPWDDYKNEIEKLFVEEGVTLISSEAFKNCHSLKSVELADSVLTIGYNAFESCEKLESVNFSKNLKNIESEAFSGCSSLSEVDLPYDIVEIDNNVFKDTKVFENAEFTDGVWYLGNYVFGSNAEAKGGLKIKQGTKAIAVGAFDNNKRLKSVFVPSSVSVIPSYAFSHCDSLEKVVFEDGVKEINAAFGNCPNLLQAHIPDSVEDIDDYAFGYGNDEVAKNFKIFGSSSSAAEKFAKDKGYEFVEE